MIKIARVFMLLYELLFVLRMIAFFLPKALRKLVVVLNASTMKTIIALLKKVFPDKKLLKLRCYFEDISYW